jgi:hypothetical protein
MSSLSLSLADGLGMEIGVDRADLDVCSGGWMGASNDGQGGRLGG